jgi:hypothetical protein
MKREDKIKLVTNISKFLSINKIPNHITQEDDSSEIVIQHESIPEKGINHIILRHIVNTTNFKAAHFDNEKFIFLFDVSEDTNPFEGK